MFVEFCKESNCVHACPEVAKIQQMEGWTHNPYRSVFKDTEESNLGDKDIVMLPLIYILINKTPRKTIDMKILYDWFFINTKTI